MIGPLGLEDLDPADDPHHVPVISFDEPDDIVSRLGIKGLGESGIVGVATAIADCYCRCCALMSLVAAAHGAGAVVVSGP